MRRYSPPYYSPPRRGYGGRGRSPPRRGSGGGYGRHKDPNHGSLLVRNIPLDCRPEELRVPFERFGVVRDVYLPKDYYTGEPRGFAFVQFVDSYDAAEAQYQMNGQYFAGREISVVLAAETRKRPEEMRKRSRVSSTSFRGPSGYGGRRSSHYGRRSCSFSHSRSRSPRRYRSRSYSPAPKRRCDYSISPDGRHADHPRSPRDVSPRRDSDCPRRSYSPSRGDNAVQVHSSNGHNMKSARKSEVDQSRWRGVSPGRDSRSPSRSRSISADISPRRNGPGEK